MADVLRSCSKTACRWPAAASLSYRYATRQVWLLDLAAVRDPSLYDLCPHHADALVVPNGWERVDSRTVKEVMVEPSAFDRAEQAARRRATAADQSTGSDVRPLVGASAGRNRYAALVEQLPRLAAEAGVPGAAHPATISAAPAAPAGPPAASPAPVDPAPSRAAPEPPLPPAPAPRPVVQHARSAAPIPSRELAPLPPGAPSQPPAPPADDVPGQLSIPVDELTDDSSGVVLQFDLAGARRRGTRP